jgi:hypothetical protein
MSPHIGHDSESGRSASAAPDALTSLLRDAGLRPPVEDWRQARVEREIERRWRAHLRQRQLRRWSLAAVLACAAVLAGLAWRAWLPAANDLSVVLQVHGRVALQSGSESRRLSVGDRLVAGSRIRTGPGAHATLSVASLASLRIDQRSDVVLRTPTALDLRSGAVYLDSGDRAGGVSVRTPLLQALDVGTRYMVVHTPREGSVVSVRDGDVEVEAAVSTRLAPGEQLQIDTAGTLRRTTIAPYAAAWTWTRAAAIPFAAEARPIRDLLTWYAHEAGLALRLVPDPILASRIDAPLGGDLSGLSADELLDVARIAGPLTLRIDAQRGELHVEL